MLNPVQQLPSLFRGLRKLQGEYTIKLKGAKPCALTTPKRVAIPLMKPVKVELERMEKQGVISRVSDWCAESNGQVRICVDLTRLNDSVCREQHPLPAVDQTLAQLAGPKIFSKLDANSRSCHADSPFPRVNPAHNVHNTFQQILFQQIAIWHHVRTRALSTLHVRKLILSDLEGVVCQIDDALVYGRTQKEHDERLFKVQKEGLTLNESFHDNKFLSWDK